VYKQKSFSSQTPGETVTVGVNVGVGVGVGVDDCEISGGEHNPTVTISTIEEGYITESSQAQIVVVSNGRNSILISLP
jgi:glycerol uptake facilitator-like aquaporin